MEFEVGAILEGKVTGITKFGAFVSLPGNRTGMVHISEVAHAYVSDINEHLAVGQEVKVKVIAIDPAGKINLSIKKTQEAPQRQPRQDRGERSFERKERNFDRPQQSRQGSNGGNRGSYNNNRSAAPRPSAPKEPQSFDDMLKQFMADSDSKISSIKQYSDHRTRSKRR